MSAARDEFLRRYATSPMHVPRLERLLAAYGAREPDLFAAAFISWDRRCPDAEAARIVTELLALFVDGNGTLVRLSDEAVRGAICWMAHTGGGSRVERSSALRTLLSSASPEAVTHATTVLEAAGTGPAPTLLSLHPDRDSTCER